MCTLGVRYKSYCSNIVRTLLINPEDSLQKTYEFLVTVEEEIINKLQHGKFKTEQESLSGMCTVWNTTILL